MAPDLKWRCSTGREERLTTISAGNTLGVSESNTATWHPHPETHWLWDPGISGTGWFWGLRRNQPTAEGCQNKNPTCGINGGKSFFWEDKETLSANYAWRLHPWFSCHSTPTCVKPWPERLENWSPLLLQVSPWPSDHHPASPLRGKKKISSAILCEVSPTWPAISQTPLFISLSLTWVYPNPT